MPKTVCILGSTGSIGTQSLKVCRKMGYKVSSLSANQNAVLLEEQAREFCPDKVVLTDHNAYLKCKDALSDTKIEVLEGESGIFNIVENPQQTVLNAMVGVAGLLPTIHALKAGNHVSLANKETLVAGGKLVTQLAKEKGLNLTPIDSEHSAIFQCLQGNDPKQVKRLIITASGGPFFGYTNEQLRQVKKQDALRHPNWNMGAKITIDSSTLMNKGLEFIEAMWLFQMPPEKIDVVVHRQSIVHSMVEYADNSVIAQLGEPDMTIPIQYALTWPQRFDSPGKPLNLLECGALTFEKPDTEVFSCLADCIEAAKRGGIYPCLLNGANEEAVKLFLEDKIEYVDIFRAVRETLQYFSYADYQTVEEVLEADKKAREFVMRVAPAGSSLRGR